MPPRMLFADTSYWVALLNPGNALSCWCHGIKRVA